MNLLLVGLGGAFGSMARYLLSTWVQEISKNPGFPFGTLAVNLTGCFVIGMLAQLSDSLGIFTPEARAFVFVGILGGFTTFSSFGNETLNLLQNSLGGNALANIGANVLFGLAMVWLGRAASHWLWK